MFCIRVFLILHLLFGFCLMIFHILATPFSSMIFVSVFEWVWVSFLMFYDTFLVRTCNILNHKKTLFVQWISMILPFRETWFFIIFLIFSVTSFGIGFWWLLVSILDPFWDPFGIKFHVFCWSFFWWVLKLFFIDCWSIVHQTGAKRLTMHHLFFASFSAHLYLLQA